MDRPRNCRGHRRPAPVTDFHISEHCLNIARPQHIELREGFGVLQQHAMSPDTWFSVGSDRGKQLVISAHSGHTAKDITHEGVGIRQPQWKEVAACLKSAGITGPSISFGFVLSSGDCPDYRQCASPEFGRKTKYLLDKAASFRGGEISDPLICLGSDRHPLP